MSECYYYYIKWWHYLFPSISIFLKPCNNITLTKICGVIIIKIIVYLLLFILLYNNKCYDRYKIIEFLYQYSFLMMILNLLLLFYIWYKNIKDKIKE
jgi:hypothetical protein